MSQHNNKEQLHLLTILAMQTHHLTTCCNCQLDMDLRYLVHNLSHTIGTVSITENYLLVVIETLLA